MRLQDWLRGKNAGLGPTLGGLGGQGHSFEGVTEGLRLEL